MSPRPGRIIGEVAGGDAEPRARDFRTSTRYAALCAEVARPCLEQAEEERA